MKSITFKTTLLTIITVSLYFASSARARPSKFTLVDSGGKGANAWKVYRGNRVRNADDLKWLKEQGVTRVIALENWNHKSLMKSAQAMGIEYVPRFMARGDRREPGRKRFGEKVTRDLVKPGHVTFVYCTYGVHRTGGIIGRFRAERGWSCDTIMKEARKYGFRESHYKKYRELLDWVRERCKQNDSAEDGRSGSENSKEE